MRCDSVTFIVDDAPNMNDAFHDYDKSHQQRADMGWIVILFPLCRGRL
jgi:hypothetical protein